MNGTAVRVAGLLAPGAAILALGLWQVAAFSPNLTTAQSGTVRAIVVAPPAPCTGPEWSGATLHTLVPGQGPFFAGNGKNIVNGSAGPDFVGGGNGRDCLLGAGGDDVLSGGRGNDYIDGGPGFDICFAILGDDTVVNCEVVVPVHDGFQHGHGPASANSSDDESAHGDDETGDPPVGEGARAADPSGDGTGAAGEAAAGDESAPDGATGPADAAPDDEATGDPAATATAEAEPPAAAPAPPPADDSEPAGTGLPSTGDVAVFIDSPPPRPPAVTEPPQTHPPGPGVVSGGGAGTP